MARYGVAPAPTPPPPPFRCTVSTLTRGQIQVEEGPGGELLSAIPLLRDEEAVARDTFAHFRELAR
jgi:hypothetical protein